MVQETEEPLKVNIRCSTRGEFDAHYAVWLINPDNPNDEIDVVFEDEDLDHVVRHCNQQRYEIVEFLGLSKLPKKVAYPLTPGLLISMAIRYNHGFGINTELFLSSSEEITESLRIKQIRILNTVIGYYQRRHKISNSATGTDKQLAEEIFGEGFYHPERETQYRATATAEALAEAQRLCEEYR